MKTNRFVLWILLAALVLMTVTSLSFTAFAEDEEPVEPDVIETEPVTETEAEPVETEPAEEPAEPAEEPAEPAQEPEEPAEDGGLTGWIKKYTAEICSILAVVASLIGALAIKLNLNPSIVKLAAFTKATSEKTTGENAAMLAKFSGYLEEAAKNEDAARKMYEENIAVLKDTLRNERKRVEMEMATADMLYAVIMAGTYPDYIKENVARDYAVICGARDTIVKDLPEAEKSETPEG